MKILLKKGPAVKTLVDKLLNNFTKWHTLKLFFYASNAMYEYFLMPVGLLFYNKGEKLG